MLDKARAHLKKYGLDGKIRLFDVSTATVALAAQAVGCDEARIVKTLSFKTDDGCLLLMAAGDAKVDNAKFKKCFGIKARMLDHDEASLLTGHEVGGICPFGVNETAKVYMDKSIERFDIVYPAAGTPNSCVELTVGQLETASNSLGRVDACKGWE
ncbi:MAG: YbaK/EbsC family protein [Clostridia bacterium]|nr:YbaK/EbsC family protein [Clostridia bacterium]